MYKCENPVLRDSKKILLSKYCTVRVLYYYQFGTALGLEQISVLRS